MSKIYVGGMKLAFDLRHDKTNKMTVLAAKTQICLGIRFALNG